MSFLYPHLLKIQRPAHQKDGEGKMGYGGVNTDPNADVLDLIAEDLRCNIQSRSAGSNSLAGLPGEPRLVQWYINMPRGQIAPGAIARGDIATDDLGRRFRVVAPYPHSLGWRITVDTLEP